MRVLGRNWCDETYCYSVPIDTVVSPPPWPLPANCVRVQWRWPYSGRFVEAGVIYALAPHYEACPNRPPPPTGATGASIGADGIDRIRVEWPVFTSCDELPKFAKRVEEKVHPDWLGQQHEFYLCAWSQTPIVGNVSAYGKIVVWARKERPGDRQPPPPPTEPPPDWVWIAAGLGAGSIGALALLRWLRRRR